MIDSHAHLNDERFNEDLAEVVERAWQSGLTGIINVGYDIPSSYRALRLARENPQMHAVVGVHPHDANDVDEAALAVIQELAQEPKVVAIGETGLDYFYDHSPRDVQRSAFRLHLSLARRLDLPVVIHSRDAVADTLTIVKEYPDVRCLLHCYSGSLETAKQYVALGHFLSFAGPISFKNANRLQEVAQALPLEHVLIETDSPYLAPVPKRGKRNEPAYVLHVAQKLAELHAVSLETVMEITRKNTCSFFGIS